MWHAQGDCHSVVCCCGWRLVVGDRVHSAGCALSEVIVYFFIHLFLVSHAYRHSHSMLSIGFGCMVGVPYWPFASHTFAVKK